MISKRRNYLYPTGPTHEEHKTSNISDDGGKPPTGFSTPPQEVGHATK